MHDVDRALGLKTAPELTAVKLKCMVRLGQYASAREFARGLLEATTGEKLRDLTASAAATESPAIQDELTAVVWYVRPENRADLHELIGLASFRLGEYEAAIEALSASLTGNPGLARSLYLRGLAYHRIGKGELENEWTVRQNVCDLLR